MTYSNLKSCQSAEPEFCWTLGHPPKGAQPCLVANRKGQVAPLIRGIIYNEVGSWCDLEFGEAITHWMPYPKAPT